MSWQLKFQVISIEQCYYRDKTGKAIEHGAWIKLVPIYDISIPEDQQFYSAVPAGELKMLVNNPKAIEYLKPGHNFYIDLTDAEE